MAFNGSGLFVRLYNWVTDRDAAVKIRADRMDAEMDGFATGLSTCVTKDGQTTATARVPFALGVGLGNGTVAEPAVNFTSDTDSGLYRIGANNIGAAVNGAKVLDISTTGLGVVGTTLGGDGTVSLPGFSFTSDTDSGFYRIGANNIGLALNGAKVADFATTGVAITGTLGASGNFAVATNKFNVTAATGNTAIAGTVSAIGAVSLGPNATTLSIPPLLTGTVLNSGGATNSNIWAVLTSYGVGGAGVDLNAGFIAQRARGTQASPTAVQDGDTLGLFSGLGYGATGFGIGGAQMVVRATQNYTDTNQGGRLDFEVTPNSTAPDAVKTIARFDQDGTIKFGNVTQYPNTAATTLVSPVGALITGAREAGFNSFMNMMAFGTSNLPGYVTHRGRGTQDSPTAVQDGDILGLFQCGGRGATGWGSTSGGQIRAVASQIWTDANQGAYVSVLTTPNNSTTETESARFEQSGGITVPSTVTGGDKGAGTVNATGLYQANVQVATLSGTEELTGKTLTASVAKGTWTASGTWTVPAHTLGGTVSGGGNQINNVIIGTSTPLAGTFTTLKATGAFVLSSIVSPAQITSNQNNYAPTNLATANILQISSDAARDITGLSSSGFVAGQVLIINNVGSFTITLKFNSGSSSAGNQFLLPGATDLAIPAFGSTRLYWDGSFFRTA